MKLAVFDIDGTVTRTYNLTCGNGCIEGEEHMLRRLVYWTVLILMLLAVSAYSLFQLSKSSTSQLFGKIVTRVPVQEKIVALTFDDGPTREGIGPILETLDRFGIQATFFLIGEAMEKYPEGAVRLLEAGHELGNHSYSHKRMVLKSPRSIREEIEKTDRLIRGAGADGEIFFRPPFSKKLILLPWYLQRNGRVTISWDIAPDSHREISRDHRRIAENVLSLARPGSIVLLHPWYPVNEETRRALPLIIEGLRSRGYRFVKVSTLLDQVNQSGHSSRQEGFAAHALPKDRAAIGVHDARGTHAVPTGPARVD